MNGANFLHADTNLGKLSVNLMVYLTNDLMN